VGTSKLIAVHFVKKEEMPAYAYKNPVPQGWRAEFEGRNLRNTRQWRIPCQQNCGVEYVLIYPADANDQLLNRYIQSINMAMQNCGHHVGRIEIND
jgi:hypothetical protein